MTERPRLHQSIAKEFVTKSPEHVRQILEGEMKRKASRQMKRGTLVDQLVFGGANYQVVDAKYKSGPRKGQPVADWTATEAKAQRDEIEKGGKLAVLPNDLEKAQTIAGRVKSVLLAQNFDPKNCHLQNTLTWTTALGVEAEGTPDFDHVVRSTKPDELGNTPPKRVDTFDLKVVESCNPDTLDKVVFDYGYDIQGFAYQEAVHKNWSTVQERGMHWLLAIEAESLVAVLCPLSEAYLELGRLRWERAQRIWMQCLESKEWPGYKSRYLVPPQYVYDRETKANV